MHQPTGRAPDLTKLDRAGCLEALGVLSPTNRLPVFTDAELTDLAALTKPGQDKPERPR